jgi:probable DNA metabolism protein
MQTISIQNYADWCQKARELLHANIHPDELVWDDKNHSQQDLFNTLNNSSANVITNNKFSVPAKFFALAEIVGCHITDTKWQKLYKVLWRITHGEKHLLEIASDPLIHELYIFEKAVRRDSHKMKAFVRFRRYADAEHEFYISWFEPDHNIIRRVAPFFQRRFGVMNWMIITPFETMVWDKHELQFFAGIEKFKHQREDEFENLWRTYYKAIFNPARIKIKAMRNEMPIRYWANMPETSIINEILHDAPARVEKMLKYNENMAPAVSDYFPHTLTDVKMVRKKS